MSPPLLAERCAAPSPSRDVVAVVVTHHPDHSHLERLLEALSAQVERVVLIDNGSGAGFGAWISTRGRDGIDMVLLDENRGIAGAHNLGFERARARGAEFVVLFDQDSLPGPTLVASLVTAVRDLHAQGVKVAAVGPHFVDERLTGVKPFVRTTGWRQRRLDCTQDTDLIEVDHLISSGSLLVLSVVEEIGGMREELFIDYVDIEWGLRANFLGYRLYGVCAVQMAHVLGQKPVRFLWRDVPMHSPLRHYYLARNRVWLCRQGWIPVGWKWGTLVKVLLSFLFMQLFAQGRLEHGRMMARGVWDGWRDCMGPCSWAPPRGVGRLDRN